MRVNVYHEELTNEVEVAHVEPVPGKRFIGLRFVLASSPKLHHTMTDDDRSAVTIWVGSHGEALGFIEDLRAAIYDDMDRQSADLRESAMPPIVKP